MIDKYICVNYGTRRLCDICDRYGRLQDDKEDISCYYSKEQEQNGLEIVVQSFAQQPIKKEEEWKIIKFPCNQHIGDEEE